MMGLLFWVLKKIGCLRLDPLEEAVGMDISRHKGSAYDIPDVKKDMIDQLNESRSQHGSTRGSKKILDESNHKAKVLEVEEPTGHEEPGTPEESA